MRYKVAAQRGYYGIGIYMPKFETNIGSLMRSAHALGASFVFTIGRRHKGSATDTSKAHKHLPYFPLPSWDAFLDFRPYDCQLVAVEMLPQARCATQFVHPERAVYLLGPEDGTLGKKILEHCQHIIRIPSEFCLNVATAGSIILYDRIAKLKETIW